MVVLMTVFILILSAILIQTLLWSADQLGNKVIAIPSQYTTHHYYTVLISATLCKSLLHVLVLIWYRFMNIMFSLWGCYRDSSCGLAEELAGSGTENHSKPATSSCGSVSRNPAVQYK